ncbi:MAG TPA: phosphatidate cytidylyltransferase [Clostridiales bacterium]|nr:phosphatidate cytidylyltransferase [Clostridiales bacterium]
MKTRIISSVVALAILFLAMFAPVWVFLIGVTFVALIAVIEYFSSVRSKEYKMSPWPILISVLSAVPLWVSMLYPLHTLGVNKDACIVVWIILTVVACTSACVFSNMKYHFADVAISIFGLLYILLPLSLIVRIRSEQHGFYLIWLVFLGAWITDISAYFTGTFFGTRKILPKISAKKTVEGFVGGILGCILAIVIYGIWMQTKGVSIHWAWYLLLGAALGFVSQVGDWFASCIKRYLDIKDFGKIMPGHGGILDRFDSVLYVTPMVYMFIILMV